jgi:asparagine N-glycosylation enzyme membrane subunit Stt3
VTSPRRARRVLAHLPFAVVMALVAVAALRIGMYHWRQGAALIGGALLVASVLRAALSDEQAGLLQIRGRSVDVLSYAGLGILILFVALTITGGPFG